MREHEIAHVVEREGALEALGRELAKPEHVSGVVDEDIDARLGRGDLRPDLLHLSDQRQIGIMDAMVDARADLAQTLERFLRPRAITGDHDDAGALPGELLGSDPADTRGRAGDDDDFAFDRTLPWYCWDGTLSAKSSRHAVLIAAPAPL